MLTRFLSLAFVVFMFLGAAANAQTQPTSPQDSAAAPAPALVQVRLKTSMGDIVLELDPAKAPITVENFLTYVKDGFYDGLIFHRVIDDFMIQGGGFNAQMDPRETRPSIQNESLNGLLNVRGSIAMARTSSPHSASAQFFVNIIDNDFLNQANSRDGWGYCVFGRVASGMEVVDKIREVPTARLGSSRNVPKTPVVIESASVIGAE
ncbi:MAG: cyclophilin family peptidyl-prolyl cis-trans isomerase [Gammaproteobacteria bacterium]|jgi:cyclophilin family peptidyl-prolyl cis-trans isomerase